MKRKLTALSSVTALVVAALATYSAVSASVAAEGDGYSTDPSNPTLVTTVPDGFTPYGDPVITTDNDVTTTKQVYSRTIKGNSGVFTAWQPAGFSEWSRDSAQPADPDGQLGDDNPLNLKMVGTPMETRTVTDQEATQGHWTEWADSGPQVRTEENTAPDVDTDTVRWVYVGETEPEIIIPAVPEVWANFSPNDSQATFVGPAVWPTDPRGTWNIHDAIPPGHEGPDGVYAKGNPDKGGNWFYRHGCVPAVTDVDYLWQQQVREWEPGTPAVTHDEFRWPLLSRTYTPGTADVTEYVYTVDAVSPETVTSNSPHGTAPNEAQAPKPPKPPVHATVPTTIDAGR
jgi:hypothetical protein